MMDITIMLAMGITLNQAITIADLILVNNNAMENQTFNVSQIVKVIQKQQEL